MPAKSHSKLPNKKAVLKGTFLIKQKFFSQLTSDSTELGLTGSNMSINIRLGSTRRLEASKTPTITACMSEEYLHKPVSCDALAIPSSSKILSDRPATAGYSLSSRLVLSGYYFSCFKRSLFNDLMVDSVSHAIAY